MGVFGAMKRAMAVFRAEEAPMGPPVPGEPARILVVDDDIALLRQAAHIIRAAGHMPISISAPQAALQMARSMAPSVILLDVLMPGFDGWDVLAALKADPQTSHIPVIMICMLGEQNQALASGASGTIDKPLEEQAVSAELVRVLSDPDLSVVRF